MTMPGFAHAAHRCAQVRRLDDDAHAERLQPLHEQVRDLLGEALLDLEAAGVHVDDARDLGQADDAAVGDVGDRGRARRTAAGGARRASRTGCP